MIRMDDTMAEQHDYQVQSIGKWGVEFLDDPWRCDKSQPEGKPEYKVFPGT